MGVDLILLSRQDEPTKPSWPLGQVYPVKPDVPALNELIAERLTSTQPEAWLFWDVELSMPDAAIVQEALSGPADIVHSGLTLGMRGLPGMIDFAAPTWMLNCDPASNIEATSWRVSLSACLVRSEVIRQMGFLNASFQSMEAAALEWGYRCIRRGVLMRQSPRLWGDSSALPPAPIPLADELRFLLFGLGRKWALWGTLRALFTGYTQAWHAMRAWRELRRIPVPPARPPFEHDNLKDAPKLDPNEREAARVSVLIPTVDRYPYLTKLLPQLLQQSRPADEIIIVDQTPASHRKTEINEDFKNLPIRIIYRDEPGQCSARNAGIQSSRGDYVLFIDDDDEIPPDLIEKHLTNLHSFHAGVSSGVADEVGAGPLPEAFTYFRASDVFPTNNSMVHRSVMEKSGLFDLAFDHGARADGDLGMRLYLSGARMVLDPSIRILHHHAPRGGLRLHKARVRTYASSRKSLTQRNLPSVTEIYLARRYFSSTQVRESILISLLGTFSLHTGDVMKRLLKGLFSLLLLPASVWTIRTRQQQANEMLRRFPQIPALPPNQG